MKAVFIDVHCHLEMHPEIESAVKRASETGVEIIVTQGVNAQTNKKALELAKNHSQVKAALGLYPIDALKLTDKEIDEVVDMMRKNKKNVSAIGEVGMDFKEDLKDHARQKKIFQKVIALSQELDKPIIVHSRKAEKECIDVLAQMKAKKVIMHCFCGKFSLVDQIAQNGWSISIPTSVKNSEHFQKVIERVPITQLLCETDAPYLHPDRLFPNEPANVIVSYEMIAKIKKMDIEDVKKAVFENYQKLF